MRGDPRHFKKAVATECLGHGSECVLSEKDPHSDRLLAPIFAPGQPCLIAVAVPQTMRRGIERGWVV
jgi:hypothetical protein